MSENPLVAHEVMQETAVGVPVMAHDAGLDLRAPRHAALRAVPALEALPALQPVGIDAPVEGGLPPVLSPVAPTPPPSSKAMSSPRRRARGLGLEALLFLATLGVGWLAWSVVLWRQGQTPAKRLMRMRCIDTRSGAAAGVATMATRELALKWVPGLVTLGLTVMAGGLVALGERHETLWDKAASTIVIDDPRGRYRP